MERDLAGFPVLYSPADMPIWDRDDPDMLSALARAEAIVTGIRRDAREGLVLPGGESGWKLELISSGSRRQFDTNAIIDRYDKRIATSVLADFVMLGQQAVGSFALADSKTKIFALAIGTYLDIICEVFNIQAIPRLIDLNGDHFAGISDYPRMVHGDIDEPDLQQFAAFVKDMVGSGVIVPDEELEKEVRRIGNLPERLETDMPDGAVSGSLKDKLESNSFYKVTSILDKYQARKITRNVAEQLLESLGLSSEKIQFYLGEVDQARGLSNGDEDESDAKAAEMAKKVLGR